MTVTMNPDGVHIGIDATNIRGGGGVTHLQEMLDAAIPESAGIGRITLWTGSATAALMPKRSWLRTRTLPWMDAGMLRRLWGQQFDLPAEVRREGCNVLFSPGGTSPTWSPVPVVTMSQNMLPFESGEAARFGRWSPMRLKMRLLRLSQGRSFRRAAGVVFLTEYARAGVSKAVGGLACPTVIVPHGVATRFQKPPRRQRQVADITRQAPFRLLYVSIVMPYKHQTTIARAAIQLVRLGVPIEVRFVGAPWEPYAAEFRATLDDLDPQRRFLKWDGSAAFEDLHSLYQAADAFVFASSCENLPNILIEAMSAGLPIACSSRGPMPEVLKDAGIYFDPESTADTARALRELFEDAVQRERIAHRAWQEAQAYSWNRCADQTLGFIARIAQRQLGET